MSSELEDILKRWKELEKRTIDVAERILENTDNPVLNLVFREISADSKKHIMVLDSIMKIRNTEVKKEELKKILSLLEEHEKIELESIEMANRLLGFSDSFGMVKKILIHLANDEWRHHELLREFLLSIYQPDENVGYV